ncbi:MAG: hypothetical protein ACTSO2_11265 [Promethearchaeota archaeon]
MLLDSADKILKDDRDEIDGYIAYAEKKYDDNICIKIANKCNELADFYYDIIEDFNKRFYEYKELSAKYYEKISKSSKIPQLRDNSRLLSILIYIQANKKDMAQKLLKNFRVQLRMKKNREIKEDWLYIIDLILIDDFKGAMHELNRLKNEMDESILSVFQKTIHYSQIAQKNKKTY